MKLYAAATTIRGADDDSRWKRSREREVAPEKVALLSTLSLSVSAVSLT